MRAQVHVRAQVYVQIQVRIRADNGLMGHESMSQMGQIFWMGQWVMGQSHLPTNPLIIFMAKVFYMILVFV